MKEGEGLAKEHIGMTMGMDKGVVIDCGSGGGGKDRKIGTTVIA